MNLEEFKRGWNILYASLGRRPQRETAELIYENYFRNIDGKRFYWACKELGKQGVQRFEPVQNIFAKMREMTIVYRAEYEEPRYCERCYDGLIYYTIEGHPYVARCSCGAEIDENGNEKYLNIPYFDKLPIGGKRTIITHTQEFINIFIDTPQSEQPSTEEITEECKEILHRFSESEQRERNEKENERKFNIQEKQKQEKQEELPF